MTAPISSKDELINKSRPRPWLVAALLTAWTVLAGAALWWLIADAGTSGNSVIRMGPEEIKTWGERLHESAALARLNSPWAIAWIFLAPYVLWVGARFNFEKARLWSRVPVLLATGAAFMLASQDLSRRLAAGQAMIVVVNYKSDVETLPAEIRKPASAVLEGFITNRFVTNRFTKVMVSGEPARLHDRFAREITTDAFLAGLNTNLPRLMSWDTEMKLPPPGPLRAGGWSAVLDGLAYVALLALAHAGVFHRRYRERERQAAVLESRLNEARLHALQAQLQPHFLFNTLNGIATLLRRDPATAEEMLTSLSDLLRAALSTSQRQEIPLREELEFLGRYLAIHRMRFGDRLQVREEIEPAVLDCLVPALLLQPLVENAIRHGLEPSGNPGCLRIAAAREGNRLKIIVEDNGVGLSATAGDRAGAGVGLANVGERLAALHGAAHEFRIEARPEGGVKASINLPARMAAATAERKEAGVT